MELELQQCPSCGMDLKKILDVVDDGSLTFCLKCQFPLVLIAGKYRLESILRRGGCSVVYLANHVHLDHEPRRVIKIVRPEFFTIKGMATRFRREVQLTAALGERNEHIVRIYDDFGQIPNIGHFYVMEYLQGNPLSSMLKDPALLPSLSFCFHLFMQLCETMQFAHEAGVVHRDLKPDNLMLIRRKRDPYFLKVLDFGIAKPMSNEEMPGAQVTQGSLGTPAYMAPEQCLNQPTDARTDLYAMGIILYELLTGRTPFLPPEGEETAYGAVVGVIEGQITREPPSPHELRPDRVNPGLERVILKALEKKPENRYPSIEAFRTAFLEEVANTPAFTQEGGGFSLEHGEAPKAFPEPRAGLSTAELEKAFTELSFSNGRGPSSSDDIDATLLYGGQLKREEDARAALEAAQTEDDDEHLTIPFGLPPRPESEPVLVLDQEKSKPLDFPDTEVVLTEVKIEGGEAIPTEDAVEPMALTKEEPAGSPDQAAKGTPLRGEKEPTAVETLMFSRQQSKVALVESVLSTPEPEAPESLAPESLAPESSVPRPMTAEPAVAPESAARQETAAYGAFQDILEDVALFSPGAVSGPAATVESAAFFDAKESPAKASVAPAPSAKVTVESTPLSAQATVESASFSGALAAKPTQPAEASLALDGAATVESAHPSLQTSAKEPEPQPPQTVESPVAESPKAPPDAATVQKLVDRIQGPRDGVVRFFVRQLQDWDADPFLLKGLQSTISQLRGFIASGAFQKVYPSCKGKVVLEAASFPREIANRFVREDVELRMLAVQSKPAKARPEAPKPIAVEARPRPTNGAAAAPASTAGALQTRAPAPAPATPPLPTFETSRAASGEQELPQVPTPMAIWGGGEIDDYEPVVLHPQGMSPGMMASVGVLLLSLVGVLYAFLGMGGAPHPISQLRAVQAQDVSSASQPKISYARISLRPDRRTFALIPVQERSSGRRELFVLFASQENRRLLVYAPQDQSRLLRRSVDLSSDRVSPQWAKDLDGKTRFPKVRTYVGTLERLQRRKHGPLELVLPDGNRNVNKIRGYVQAGIQFPMDSMILIVGQKPKPPEKHHFTVLWVSLFLAVCSGGAFLSLHRRNQRAF